MTIDAVLGPAEIARLSPAELIGTTCVVFDVLRATSSMITGLAHGAAAIHPVCTIEEALAARLQMPEALLGGERHGERIAGFDLGNSPLEYTCLAGRSIISTTTNGTIALRACDAAPLVLVASVLNLQAVADVLCSLGAERVLMVCAGTFESFALEDAWGGGRLIELLGTPECTDAAKALLAVSRLYPEPLQALHQARNGKVLVAKGRENELDWCARESVFSTVGVLERGVVRTYEGNGLPAAKNSATVPLHAR